MRILEHYLSLTIIEVSILALIVSLLHRNWILSVWIIFSILVYIFYLIEEKKSKELENKLSIIKRRLIEKIVESHNQTIENSELKKKLYQGRDLKSTNKNFE